MRFPNPNLGAYCRFSPSLRVADSYIGATSGPRLGPGGILVGLLSSGTPGRPIRRSRGVTPSSVAPSAWGTRRVAQGLEYILASFVSAVQPPLAGSLGP